MHRTGVNQLRLLDRKRFGDGLRGELVIDRLLTIGDETVQKAVTNTSTEKVCAACGNNKKAGVQPLAGITWGQVAACTDMVAVCC